MKRYGKLTEGVLSYAPRTKTIGNVYYNPTPLFWLKENGYKEVLLAPMPDDAPEGFHYEYSWTDDGEHIVQVWTLVEDEPSENGKDKLV